MTISLRWRLLLVTTAIAGAALAGIGLFSSRITLTEVERRGASQHGVTLDPASCQLPLEQYWKSHGGWDGVQTLLRSLSGNRARLLLVSPDLRILAGWPGGLATARLTVEPDDRLRIEVESRGADGRADKQVIAVRGAPHVALADGNRPLGLLYVLPAEVGSDERREVRAAVNRSLLHAVLVAFGAAILATLLLARYILRPVHALTAAAGRIAEGDFAQRVPVASRDEIGSLAHSFNSMADRLARTEQLRRNLVNDVSHELRTPLTRMRCQVEAIQDGLSPATPESIGGLHEQLLALERLVDDLQDLALSDAGQLKLTMAPVRLEGVIRSVADAARPMADGRGVTIQTEVPPDLPAVRADERRVRQILDNLLGNALRHAPGGSRVVIAARALSGAVEISVTDSGPGIPPEQVELVFERFYRVDDSRTRATGGSGLGLAIVKQLVEAQGGTVSVASTPGSGSTFRFTLFIVP